MSEDHPARDRFQQAYVGKPPWDIGKPQPAFVAAADRIRGAILDAGCGTGENTLFFAARGHQVTGIDFLEHPVEEARRKAQQRGVSATFLVRDALELTDMSDAFDSVIDCGLFHVFSDEERRRYVHSLTKAVKPEGRTFLMCFSDREPPGHGPRRISQHELHAAFASGWEIESIIESRFEVRPDLVDVQFSPGGPLAWFCEIRKTASSAVEPWS
jgi:cyclopropane fatty-acyl-phospholipid synthase-like methyltransferase